MKRIQKHAGGKSRQALPDKQVHPASGKGVDSPPPQRPSPGPAGKRPYQRPILDRYGTLEELTGASGAVTTADGGSTPTA